MVSRRSCFICPVWMLLCFPSDMCTHNCTEFNQTVIIRDHQVHQGMSTIISCHYNKTRSQSLSVSLRTQRKLCEYRYLNVSWSKQFCNDNITFIWIPEREEISFQLTNLQISKSGVYTCTVEQYLPPPTRCLGEKRTQIHVKAPPSVSVSCVKGPEGAPTVLCTSESFYPNDLKQVWLRDREYISYQNTSLRRLYTENLNSSDTSCKYSNNADGTYSVTSYLNTSSNIAVYYCWVNHSTLGQPITVNISSTECTETNEALTGVFLSVTGICCGVIASIGLIFAGCYRGLRRRTYFQSPVETSPLPEPHTTLRTQENLQVYSNLGNHQPVPQVYSNLRNHQPARQAYLTLEYHQPVPQVYSTLGNHQPVPCRNDSNDTTSRSL